MVLDTLTVNGTIDASAPATPRCGSGGSVWLTMSNFTGTGAIKAEGGTPPSTDSCGGGGRIALDYTNSTFTGTVSVAGGAKTYPAQPGTLWEPKRFAGKTGSQGAPLAMIITNSYQYYFPDSSVTNYWNLTVSNAWFEAHGGSMQICDLILTNGSFGYDGFAASQPWAIDMTYLDITNKIRLTGSSVAYLGAQSFALSSLLVDTNSVLKLRGNPLAVNSDSGGTVPIPHGAGATITCPNVTVNGTITAIGDGFPGNTGPGLGTGTDGSAYGGQGNGSTSKPYGKLARPSALGTGGLATTANAKPGGGVVRLIVSGTLTVNGVIDATAADSARTGAGGSIWLTASNLTGGGTIKANSASGSAGSYGGGGRIAVSAVNDTFSGAYAVACFGNARTGTIFRCVAPVFGCCDPGVTAPSLATDFAVQSNGVYVTRQVTQWAKSFQWTDDSRDPGSNAWNNVAQYTLSGLPANTKYSVYTNGALLVSLTNSGVSGTLSLGNILLQSASTVLVEQQSARGTQISIR